MSSRTSVCSPKAQTERVAAEEERSERKTATRQAKDDMLKTRLGNMTDDEVTTLLSSSYFDGLSEREQGRVRGLLDELGHKFQAESDLMEATYDEEQAEANFDAELQNDQAFVLPWETNRTDQDEEAEAEEFDETDGRVDETDDSERT